MGGLIYHLATLVLILHGSDAQLFPKTDSLLGGYQLACPVEKAMPKFDLDKFMGDWFPPRSGHFYHVPTFSTVSGLDSAIWETQFKGVDLVSAILDTDYSRWAVLAQCSRPNGVKGDPKFFSTRIMARTRALGAADLARIQAAIQESGVGAPFKYPVEQGVCQEIDGI